MISVPTTQGCHAPHPTASVTCEKEKGHAGYHSFTVSENGFTECWKECVPTSPTDSGEARQDAGRPSWGFSGYLEVFPEVPPEKPVLQDVPQGAREWLYESPTGISRWKNEAIGNDSISTTVGRIAEWCNGYAAHVCEERDKEIKRVEQQRNEHFAEIVRAREIIAGQIKRAETAEAALRAEREKEPPTRELVLVAMHRDFCRMRAALEPFVYPERWLKDGQCLHCGATETDDNCRIIHNSVCVVTEARTALQSGAEAAERAGQ